MSKTRNSRVCKQCKKDFIPTRSYMPICSEECAIIWAKEVVAKKKRKDDRQAKIDYNWKSKPWLYKALQKEVNAYVLLRDKGKPCISCGKKANRYEAGHYMPAGQNAQIRFDLNNIHAQCHTCNCHKSANLREYRPNLIKKIGLEAVEQLEHRYVKIWQVEELQGMIIEFRKKNKFMKKREKESVDLVIVKNDEKGGG